jgi:hypothetical protein
MKHLPAGLLLLAAAASAQEVVQVPLKTRFSAVVQSGFAETFQLTLGGTFGEGPALQNRLTLNIDNALRRGDRVVLTGWSTFDIPGHHPDWLAGFTYRPGSLSEKRTRSSLSYGIGFQRWRFPSVLGGAQDWLVAADLNWQSRLPLSPWATSEFWYNFHSNLPVGQLLYSQAGVQHQVWKNDRVRFTYKHGGAFTQSWGFYGKNGTRVVRYTGTLAAAFGPHTLEAGVRPQHGLQPGIPNNTFWIFTYARRFGQ